MIDRLIAFSARHRFPVLVLAAAAALMGWEAATRLPLDTLPDIGEKQVIVYSQWNRSPDVVDAQVTFPIVSALLGAPRVKSVRGVSDFGTSLVYVVFDDVTDLYWARSRTLEYLSAVLPRLPEGVSTELGPDATSLGWVFQYILSDSSGRHSLADLRAYQDWYLKYYLKAVPGVSEVATVGGFARQYQVNVDPDRLRAFGVTIQRVVEALRDANRDVGAGIVEAGGSELLVRGLGQTDATQDLEEILIALSDDGTPIRVRDVAHVSVGAEIRRGVIDFDGVGDTVSGIVVMRQGANALDVIDRVKAKIREIRASLPQGMQIVPVYDRSELVRRSIDNLRSTILEVIGTVVVVIVVFLWHIPSAAVPVLTLPLAILIAFIPLHLVGVSANVMSLGGIAMAIGALVDAAIVVVEQTYKELGDWKKSGRPGDSAAIAVAAIKRVGRPSFFALLVIAVSFLPILTLQGETGKLFGPLAYAKSFAMAVAAFLAVTVTPALLLLFTRMTPFDFRPAWICRVANATLVGTTRSEMEHPLSRRIIRYYEPVVEWSLGHKRVVGAAVIALLAVTIPVFRALGSEFMPTIDEGVLLYMPSTMPGISIAEAGHLLQATDKALMQFPEVEHVLGKAGRADSATDPAPLSMLETLVVLRPREAWRRVPTWYSSWAPSWAQRVLRRVASDRISREELVNEMNRALTLPGVTNAWSMPVRGRIDMLMTGIRTPLGLKVSGGSVEEIERASAEIATRLASLTGTRGVSAERTGQGNFLDIRWNRGALSAAGIGIGDAQAAVQYAIGGERVTTILKGRERYPVIVRYESDFRSDPEAIRRILIPNLRGQERTPIGDVADVRRTQGPVMLRNEDGLLTGYVYVDISRSDVDGYIDEASRAIQNTIASHPGLSISWAGQYQALLETRRHLRTVVPLTVLIIVLLLYASTRSLSNTLLVLLAVPFSAIGAVWLVYALGYQTSAAVWVGFIALLGVDAETGVFMLLYLDDAHERAKLENRLHGPDGLHRAILEGASRRVRPKFMTVATMFIGLLPIMWSVGPGSDVMKRIAAPMIGGILTSFLLELIVYPVIYHELKSRQSRTSSNRYATTP
jgi:Cu(I)/Ag(I) efflux system membrane protein CusA/SilA